LTKNETLLNCLGVLLELIIQDGNGRGPGKV